MYYTYLWLREDGTPYYVGKGGYANRAFEKHKVGNRKACAPLKERIVIYPAESEDDAFETEVALIWYYGRKDLGTGILRNQTNGGEGSSGTNEGHRKQAEALRGRPFTSEHCRKLSNAKKGNKARLGMRKSHCKRGHDLSKTFYIDSRGGRQCMECRNTRDKQYYKDHKKEIIARAKEWKKNHATS